MEIPQNTTLSDGKQTHQDSISNVADIDIQEYHEIVFGVSCEQEFLQDIVMQSIADIILESGDGVEFIDGSMIVLEQHNNS